MKSKSKTMEVKFKKVHEDAKTPKYATNGDAGMDLTAVRVERIDNHHMRYYFGLELEIPDGYVGYIFPRSSCYKQGQMLSCSVGVIDSGYRGEISATFLGDEPSKMYREGERCAQLIIMPYPQIEMVEAKELSQTLRGKGGYGSTGK